MSREVLPTEEGNIFVYYCDICGANKNHARVCKYCDQDCCTKCSQITKKDLVWPHKTEYNIVCGDCLNVFYRDYEQKVKDLVNQLTEIENELGS